MDVPFKADVNGRSCVVYACAGKLRIEHGAGSLDVPYSSVRCLQRDRRRITLNAEAGGRLVLYSVESAGARKLYGLLLSGCASSESSGPGSGARNSNLQTAPSSSQDSRSRVPRGERPSLSSGRS